VTITASEARKNLFPLIEQVNNDRQPIEITSRRGDAVLMSRADYDALTEQRGSSEFPPMPLGSSKASTKRKLGSDRNIHFNHEAGVHAPWLG